ncbi:hypothetical protein ILYODFUR_034585 [Ilyodon furcidens]|uniref:Secreted protein n=1 Tax=Ilyodon furcidens TaxID=33524 RepID=A0ABV0UYW3_9TELE
MAITCICVIFQLQTATPVKYPTGYSKPGTLAKRPKLTVSSVNMIAPVLKSVLSHNCHIYTFLKFDRSRFCGRHVESAKPNINVAQKTHVSTEIYLLLLLS